MTAERRNGWHAGLYVAGTMRRAAAGTVVPIFTPLGIVLYELVTNRLPFAFQSLADAYFDAPPRHAAGAAQ